MGKAVYVFNCSDQMDYLSLAGIFKGLAASGSWGCFDEFNRLVPEVLSVCSVQFKSVTDAIKAKATRFTIQEAEISLDPSCGAFITMNPGYIGRSELPEGLKALFRPITVVVPDLELICQNMLMAEGFVEAKDLARKFTTLYFLCRDLLSAAKHYDWGLRAIKSVLVVAGGFKRAEPDLAENAILMRALRDFNLPKIAAEDLEIFGGLLGDLFPAINPPRNRDLDFESVVEEAAEETNMHSAPEFILKIIQLKELMEIRHSVFVMGPPGCGKSQTWKTLGKAQTKAGMKTSIIDINPKVVSTNEFYGVVHLQTREWIDGLFSCKLRDFSKETDTNPKWIILDGDLDANWIESMNSVMDDNKLLTLASNERISLKPHMKLIFEIRNLNHATPATVSRAGILYISDDDGYQWRAYVKSWIKHSPYEADRKEALQRLFDNYIDECYQYMRKTFKTIVPVQLISQVTCICKLLESLLLNEVKGLEFIFVFAAVWCMGAGLEIQEGNKSRLAFDKFWREKFKTIKFPTKGTVFDYYVDIDHSKLVDWNNLRSDSVENSIDTSRAITNYTVPTSDTIASQYIMKNFITIGIAPMLVGNAGCGKTQIINGLLNELTTTTEDYKS
jgi:dynein heavy chain